MELADRLDRLWAALIDRFMFFALAAIALVGTFSNGGSGASGLGIGIGLVGILAVFAANIWLLSTRGQTIGKKLLGIRIVLVKDLSNGGFVTNVLLRAGVPWIINFVPLIGTLFMISDPLFIFREDRLCLHDQIAGTCVIKG